ncbi:hypothetical protein [Ramlibacter sp. PS4R-6]|uniref:hypothetical protein n=1 Tax=Ramlibacter sp. PS4R-6 TaxID=3133438 RepID=UPI0030A6991A
MRKQDKRFSRKSLASFGAAALLALTAAVAQVAVAQGGTQLDTSGNYRSEIHACMQGQTGQAQADCLKEARNAQADKQRGVLDAGTNYQANARARCGVLTGEDRAACEARMMGYGTVSGSVAGGGVIREVETVVMPPGQGSITVDAKTSDPVVLVPVQK